MAHKQPFEEVIPEAPYPRRRRPGIAKEELVAELGAAFLCADLSLKLEDRTDHAAYIGSWLKVLKNDSKAIFSAAAYAQWAVDYLHNLQNDEGSS